MPVKNRPGRPPLQQAQGACDSIVSSACLHFARQGIKGTSNRQIAETAKVTAAMVHYYFKRKEDLHLAVLQAAFTPLINDLQQDAPQQVQKKPAQKNTQKETQKETQKKTQKEQAITLEAWVHAFHAHLAAHQWLPHLMIREVLPQNGELRKPFLQHFAPQLFGSIKAMVTTESQRRKVREDFDIDRHVVLLMGMLVYPFLGLELAQNVTGRKFDKKMLEGFRDDALRLFRKGISAP